MKLTRNKAEEKFALYNAAELKGEDELADQLEKELNAGGWSIVTDEENGGLTIQKDSSDGFLSGIGGNWGNNNFRDTSNPPTYRSGSGASRGMSTGQIVLLSLIGLSVIAGVVIYVRHQNKTKTPVPNG